MKLKHPGVKCRRQLARAARMPRAQRAWRTEAATAWDRRTAVIHPDAFSTLAMATSHVRVRPCGARRVGEEWAGCPQPGGTTRPGAGQETACGATVAAHAREAGTSSVELVMRRSRVRFP